jgi:hypothetical protein
VALAGLVLLMFIPPGPLDLRAPMGIVLIQFPGVVEVTLTVTVHEPGVVPVWAGTVPPLNDTVDEPAAAVTLPPQVFEPTLTTLMLAGILSVQEALVSGNPFGLKMVTRSTDVPPDEIDLGVNVLFISAGSEI